jgi:hypothetical protein
MRARTLHKYIGVVLLVPFFGWAITGLVFFIKPGYAGAYEILTPKTYPLEKAEPVVADPGWVEFRYFRTVLGDHLIARTDKGWVHLDPRNKQPRSFPTESEMRLLVKDAFSVNLRRYGDIVNISGDTIQTDTNVVVKLDWSRLSFQQKGKDTQRIDMLYKIHYLQWSGVETIDKVLGITGLLLIVILTSLGVWLVIKG